MNKFCPKCGTPVMPENKFCPKCGASLNGQRPNVAGEKIEPEADKSKMIVCALIAAVAIGGGFWGYSHFSAEKPAESLAVSSSTDTAGQAGSGSSSVKEPEAKPAIDESLQRGKELIQKMGVEVKNIEAFSGYVEQNSGFMAKLDGKVMIFDTANHRVAEVKNPECLKEFQAGRKKGGTNSVIVKFNILNDTPGEDRNSGEWNGTDHYIPMFICWKLEGIKSVDAGIYTGKGKNPGHYHGYLYEQKNVDLAHVFLATADKLAGDMDRRGVL